MRCAVLLVVVLAGAASSCASEESAPACEDVSTTVLDGGVSHASPAAALGDLLADADRVTEQADDSKGFETVTFRGYDEDGDLVGRVVVEGGGRGWVAARVDTCG
ncbi:hypothetical protein GCM10011376_03310 [Nocardioides flavus (ex Wang et al. 2016)]|uniref:Uncharacterized protein n=1 Tax=Nocardioides flavus (ex Wang et al. 2016) TaxID=2058780 RepID=A0ABQ3HG22_9ACTN|nr:hypothetical protein [Nocardioides flavus (ex Wang et al. 2016)]GHE15385.1 hypothetical protein GCM10011376_03310 [Nocardioides flavus (ex Wang et al. 2016)]